MSSPHAARVMPDPWFTAQTSNFTICHLLQEGREYGRQLGEGERILGRFILPPFQRPPVWSQAQQIRLIESIWGGLPIGSYCYNQPHYALARPISDGWLLDGQQRVTAILDYVRGKFPVLGWRYPDLPRGEQRGFESKGFPANITRIIDSGECYEVYRRLAYGGTAHEPEAAR